MNGRSRTLAAINGQPVDRIPVAQHNFPFVVAQSGLTMKEFVFEPQKAAKALAKVAYEFDYDCIIIDFDTCALAEAMGAKLMFPDDEPARIDVPAVESIKDVPSLAIPDPEADGRLPLWLETTKLLREIVGDDKAIMGRADQGPFGLLFLLRDSQSLMMDLLDEDEDTIFAALDHCAEAGARFAKKQIEYGADLTSIGDGASGQSLVAPWMYEKFSQPFERKYKEIIGDAMLSLHICGKTNNIIEPMVQTGCEVLELDHYNDLDHTFQVVQNRACVFGNIDPASVICFGSVDEVKAKCREAIEIAIKHQARFVLCPGCLVNANTPPQNIAAMSEVAKEYTF